MEDEGKGKVGSKTESMFLGSGDNVSSERNGWVGEWMDDGWMKENKK